MRADTAPSWVRVPDGVSIRVLDDQAVVLNAESGQYYGLDRSAVAFWEAMLAARTREQAVATLSREFDADDSVLGADLDHFCAELEKRGLVTLDGS